MPANPEPAFFEAISTPSRSFHRGLFALLAGVTVLWAIIGGTVFVLMGAWPVMGFLGLESALALGLVCLHHRWSARACEIVRIADGRLTVRRTDGMGRGMQASMDPYWAQVDLSERQGLMLVQRDRRISIGAYLSESEKADFAEALREALAAYRWPSFDNPQLRE